MATPNTQDQDPRSLHDLAVDIHTDILKLATGLAHAGAHPQSVQPLSRVADMFAGIAKSLAAGAPLDQGQTQPGAQRPQQAPQGQPQQAPQGQPQQAPQGQPQQAPQGQPQAQPAQVSAHHALHAAAHATQAAMMASAQRRQQAQPQR